MELGRARLVMRLCRARNEPSFAITMILQSMRLTMGLD